MLALSRLNALFWKEAFFVGITLIATGSLATWTIEYVMHGRVKEWFPPHFADMAFGLFLAGVIAHAFFELSGLNDTYARYKFRAINKA